MVEGFRVQSVAIEGFKGFTMRQEIDFQGRHAFLLGKNGHGKSSIVEAVRWGLFGSWGTRNEEIANRDYPGQCRVEVSLMRDGRRLNLRRTVLRGVTGGNDAVLTGEQGLEEPIREVMPRLDSVDAGEGMHIIFAPQSGPLRRLPEDLSAFEKTVLYHLGLTQPRSLLSQIHKFTDEQQLMEDNLGKDVDDVRDEVDKKVDYLQRQRGTILGSPPWDDNHVPSVAETENKVRALIIEVTGGESDQSLAGVSLDALIDSAEDSLEVRSTQNQEALEGELANIVGQKNRLGGLSEALVTVGECESAIEDTQSRLNEALGSTSLDDLRHKTNEAWVAADTAALRLQIVHAASSLLERDQVEQACCPICEVEHDRNDLQTTLQRTADQLSGTATGSPSQLESRLSEAEALSHELERFSTELGNLNQIANDVRERIIADDDEALPENIGVEELKSKIDRHEEREGSIQEQLENQKRWLALVQARLSNFKEEEKFHQNQKDLVELEQSKNQLDRVETAYQDLVSFGESVQSIQAAISTCLNERLEEEIPAVSEKLSRVFAALTHHPWYDQLTINKSVLPKLELQVISSADPTGRVYSTGVLNGQAESALALVPYFAFSQAVDTPTEVYLVLLDDPTRAFDEDHIEILVEELAELGKHVQLVVASQESSQFRALVSKYFDQGTYVIVEPAGWSHDGGPELSIE